MVPPRQVGFYTNMYPLDRVARAGFAVGLICKLHQVLLALETTLYGTASHSPAFKRWRPGLHKNAELGLHSTS